MRLILLLLQETAGDPTGIMNQEAVLLTLAQVGVVLFLVAAIALIAFLLIRTGVGSRTLAQDERSWLDYGNFFIVCLGLAGVIIGFLVTLLFANLFDDRTQALGFLTALFGVITGLVGTYFGIKSSSDARAGAEKTANLAANGTTTPTITIRPSSATLHVNAGHTVTADVRSVDGSSAANVPVTFTIIAGPDMDSTETVTRNTDSSGRAPFTVNNNGTEGIDTIEAVALGGKGTATVTFTSPSE